MYNSLIHRDSEESFYSYEAVGTSLPTMIFDLGSKVTEASGASTRPLHYRPISLAQAHTALSAIGLHKSISLGTDSPSASTFG